MAEYHSLATAYDLPFEVRYSNEDIFSTGGVVHGTAKVRNGASVDSTPLPSTLDLFARLASTGALAGKDLSPAHSGLTFGPHSHAGGSLITFEFVGCRTDQRALIVLAHLCFGLQDVVRLESLEFSAPATRASRRLPLIPQGLSTYPEIYRPLPFAFEDEDPEGGAYTFSAELKEPLSEASAKALTESLNTWVEALLTGAYGLAPIPPQECYVEPQEEGLTAFGQTVEWTAFKVRADPSCVNGLVNMFAAFHHRCQEIRELTIS